jgi:vacuolar-type H+-ATPase subunit C/Vma6
MTGYDYGNTRLRGRRAGLLRGPQYAALADRDLPALVAALATTSYRPQAEAASADLESLNRVARDHMVAALTGVRGFYRGRAGKVAAAVLGRFDVHAVLTVLRARHLGSPADAACALLIPVGAVSADTARRAAGEPDLPAAAGFFAARRLPDAGTAATLLRAQARYEIDGDLASVEEAVTRTARSHQAQVLAEAGAEADQVTSALAREADDLNLLLALRLREGDAGGSGAGDSAGADDAYLPGGLVPLPVLRAARRSPSRQEAVAAAETTGHETWRGPLADWSRGGDLAGLHAALLDEGLRAQLRTLRGGDPLAAAPVLYYVLAHQAQARNLRLLGQAAVGAISHDQARRRLIAPV